MQRIAILYDAVQAVLSTFDLDEALNQILTIVRDYFRLENGSILLVDEDTKELYSRAYFGETEYTAHTRIPMGSGISGAAAKLKRPVYCPDVSRDERYICTIPSTRSELAVPLMVQDEVVGVLDCQSSTLDNFDHETIDLLMLFAAQASIGLQNAKLYSMLQRRAAQLEAINAIAKQTTVELELKDLVERFCAQLPVSLPVDHVAVFLRNEDGDLELQAEYGTMIGRLNAAQLIKEYGPEQSGLRFGSPAGASLPVLFADAQAELCLPLVSFGENVGLLACISSKLQSFSKNDTQALESVADILATAIQNSRYVERVRQMAFRDGLTGSFNRRYFEVRLADEITRAQRYRQPLSMLMVDIDHFKLVNDEFGHLLGDEVLRQAAALMARQLRKVDIVCRYGGEEFAILLPSTGLDSAVNVGEKLRRTIEMHHFPGVPRPVTVSVGAAELPPDGRVRDDLVRPADQSLYEAKQLGRNQIYPPCKARVGRGD